MTHTSSIVHRRLVRRLSVCRGARCLAAVVVWLLLAGCSHSNGPAGLLTPGESVPQLKAAGWLNGTVPSPQQLAGKLLVIDVWAHW